MRQLMFMAVVILCTSKVLGDEPARRSGFALFDKDNLVAWCIVPFDAKQRGPAARAEMLTKLGIKKVAYDWRDKHVVTFEEEILAYKKHGLEYFAFWSWHPAMEPLIQKHDIHPQIWQMIPAPIGDTQEQRITDAAQKLQPVVEKTRQLGCQLALYNHGGWGGEPANMVAVCKTLREKHKAKHVGIVYNLHHGHDHIKDFAQILKLMQPYLFCLNVNGMNTDAEPKILPIGDGQHDIELLRIISESGYHGPIGVLDHRSEMDSEKALRLNLDGLNAAIATLRQGSQ